MPAQPTRTRSPGSDGAPPDPWRDWRTDLLSTSGLNASAGVWLILAPFALSYTGEDPYWNDVVSGTTIAAIAFISLGGGARASVLSRINAVVALWIFLPAFWLDHSHRAASNDIAVGVIVCLLALASAAATDRAPQR